MAITPNGTPTTRRSDLPPPHNLHAISEDLTEAQREMVSAKAREEARDRRDARVDGKLESIVESLVWLKRLIGGAILLALAKGFIDHLVPAARLIGGGP